LNFKTTVPKKNFADRYPSTNPEIIKILHNMLEFNPGFRLEPGQILKNKVFDCIRN